MTRSHRGVGDLVGDREIKKETGQIHVATRSHRGVRDQAGDIVGDKAGDK